MADKTSCDNPPLHILATIPSTGHWKSHTGQCIADMCAYWGQSLYDGPKTLQVLGVRGTLPHVRRLCVAEALKRPDVTHHLWIDSDMVFPPDALNRLIHHALPVVGVNYVTKTIPPTPVAYCDDLEYTGPLWTEKESTGLREVAHTGMGLMLVDVRVYELLDWPMFKFEPIPPQNFRDIGEDVYFCNRLAEKSMKVYVDHDLSQEIKHIGDLEYDHLMAEKSEQKLQEYRKEQWATTVPGSTKDPDKPANGEAHA